MGQSWAHKLLSFFTTLFIQDKSTYDDNTIKSAAKQRDLTVEDRDAYSTESTDDGEDTEFAFEIAGYSPTNAAPKEDNNVTPDKRLSENCSALFAIKHQSNQAEMRYDKFLSL